VIFDFYLLPLVMLFMPVLRANQVRIVVDVHDSKRTNPRRRIYFVMMRACHLAIAISDFILDQLERGPKARVRIYRPVSTPFEATRNLERDPAVRSVPRVGLVGQISPDKNLKQALEAIAASGHPVEVVMRGGTTEENRVYHSEVAKLGEALFRDAFVDEGRVQHARAMADIDILVLTNENEPFGRVAAEAQLAGVIVVGPSEGGIGEVLEDGRTGFSFEKDDVGGLVRAIGRAVVEVRTPTDIAVRAQRAARRRFDPVTQSRKYYDALQHA
jgi:glycosyltransferase involved in cell wall biosynthesis